MNSFLSTNSWSYCVLSSLSEAPLGSTDHCSRRSFRIHASGEEGEPAKNAEDDDDEWGIVSQVEQADWLVWERYVCRSGQLGGYIEVYWWVDCCMIGKSRFRKYGGRDGERRDWWSGEQCGVGALPSEGMLCVYGARPLEFEIQYLGWIRLCVIVVVFFWAHWSRF